MPYLLTLAHERLGWPSREDVLKPKGVWPRILAEAARKKIGGQINQIKEVSRDARIGILAANPSGEATEAPLAIVCEFSRPVSESTVRLAQKLAWNFSWSPQLIIVEPHLIRSFTCCKPPDDDEDLAYFEIAQTNQDGLESRDQSPAGQAARSLHWINLISGQFFRDHEDRFKRNQRADHMLLENLKHLRKILIKDGLEEGICHDLLARIIFIQFLWDRKDSQGRAAIDKKTLSELNERGVLSQKYSSLSGILKSKRDTYSLFLYLDQKFNGDLFAGIDDPSNSKEENWRVEKNIVTEKHLEKLAEFIDGILEMCSGQLNLWKHYSFDVIPLEFISSIYEEFLTKKKKKKKNEKQKDNSEEEKDKGVHFTPAFIVDFMLDGVLPWDSDEWDIKILDPSCGSAIFLVKAFQRLVHRWKNAHPDKTPGVENLRNILEHNLFGVDINPMAVRVASFSLYLAMCDELEPLYIWKKARFPNLRGKRILCSDFFREDTNGFRTEKDAGIYDLVIGNAPWGKNTVKKKDPAELWAKSEPGGKWPLTYNDIGPLFLPKAASLTKPAGAVSMIMPSQSLLMNVSGPALKFRKQLFETYKVEEVINLSPFRFGLFKDSISPACIISLNPALPDTEPLSYICPKPSATTEDDFMIVIERHDINEVYQNEAAEDTAIWSTLMWGGRRDKGLIKRLNTWDNLNKLSQAAKVRTRMGIISGNRRKKQERLLNRHILTTEEELIEGPLIIKASALPLNQNALTDEKASTDLSAFEPPQMIIRRSWKADSGFQAIIIQPDRNNRGALCTESFISIHFKNASDRKAAFFSYNSIVAVYYLLLSSGQFSSYIPRPAVKDQLSVPLPPSMNEMANGYSYLIDIDNQIQALFGFDDAEWALIEDLVKITLVDFKGNINSAGRKPTIQLYEDHAVRYCDYFRRVLKAGFGQDKKISATIFQEKGHERLPVRMVAVHLGSPEGDETKTEVMDNDSLYDRLQELYQKFMDLENAARPGIYFRRVFRVYDVATIKNKKVPTVYLIKPDQVRYWTRSMAMRDADEVAADLMGWRNPGSDFKV